MVEWIKITLLKKKLEELGHNAFFVGLQCGLVKAGHKGADLHDDTCAVITSQEYLEL